MENELSQLVRNSLHLSDDSDIALDKVLLDLGFDSMGLAKFASAINEKYALDITPVLFFEYPSVAALATYLSVEREDRVRPFHRGSELPAGEKPGEQQRNLDGTAET